eukprot:GHVQ01006881.1.p1 GENE.GHVQ01006881.1~~GHVQ01006881.1.p1  ORF type:complete len:379 (+),score=69.58 GHVQ01006881.1:171-1139(+)
MPVTTVSIESVCLRCIRTRRPLVMLWIALMGGGFLLPNFCCCSSTAPVVKNSDWPNPDTATSSLLSPHTPPATSVTLIASCHTDFSLTNPSIISHHQTPIHSHTTLPSFHKRGENITAFRRPSTVVGPSVNTLSSQNNNNSNSSFMKEYYYSRHIPDYIIKPTPTTLSVGLPPAQPHQQQQVQPLQQQQQGRRLFRIIDKILGHNQPKGQQKGYRGYFFFAVAVVHLALLASGLKFGEHFVLRCFHWMYALSFLALLLHKSDQTRHEVHTLLDGMVSEARLFFEDRDAWEASISAPSYRNAMDADVPGNEEEEEEYWSGECG